MLPLDSSEWGRIRHCYHEASDIPDMLRQLEADPRPKEEYTDEPWFSLWSSLCHQNDVYPASYATVPHLVRIMLSVEGPIAPDFFDLPACIEIARVEKHGPEITPELAKPYFDALSRLPECTYRHASYPWSESMTESVVTAIAAAKKHMKLAHALRDLDPDIIDRVIRLDFD